MAQSTLRARLEAGEFIVAPGIQDMITAVLANDVGFDAVYGSGYWLTASAHGLPDAGIASVTQMVDRMATLVEISDAPVIADADTGYGGLLNVHHTVRAYEKAGVAALQLEDQEFPKKCGHTPNKRIVSIEDMVERIKVARDARISDDLIIIARTDARQIEGLDVAQLIADHRQAVCGAFDQPMLANMASGGVTPILPTDRLKALGFSVAIFPALASLASAAAAYAALAVLKDKGTGTDPAIPLYDFRRFCEQIGFSEVWDFEKRWARD